MAPPYRPFSLCGPFCFGFRGFLFRNLFTFYIGPSVPLSTPRAPTYCVALSEVGFTTKSYILRIGQVRSPGKMCNEGTFCLLKHRALLIRCGPFLLNYRAVVNKNETFLLKSRVVINKNDH